MFRAADFFDLKQCSFPELFDGDEHVWDALKRLPDFIKQHLKPAQLCTTIGTPYVADDVFIGSAPIWVHVIASELRYTRFVLLLPPTK